MPGSILHVPAEAAVKSLCVCRMRRIFRQVDLQDFSCVNAQVLGAEDTYGPNARTKVTPPRAVTQACDRWHTVKVPILKERGDVWC